MKRAETTLGQLVENYDSVRVPVAASKRVPGMYPYYGASGIIDWIDGYLFDGEYLLIAEDGENLRTRSTPVAFIASGKFWANNHAHVVRGRPGIADTRFLSHLLSVTDISGYLTGSTQPKLSQESMNAIRVAVPALPEQQAIAELLGALDDKIAANSVMVDTATDLARALAGRAIEFGAESELGVLADITMGSSPKGSSYNEAGQGVVLYQGVRDFGVRFPTPRVWTTQPVRIAKANDVLVSVRAPVGTLNFAQEDCCIGRGVAAVRSATPMALFHLLGIQPEIFASFDNDGTIFGSINKNQLNQLPVRIPASGLAGLNSELEPIEAMVAASLSESQTLAELRDTLLPALMDGTIRVKDALTPAEEAL